jgi:hypothetical protein
MSRQYRREEKGAPRGLRAGRPPTQAELDFNQRVKAEAEKPLWQYVRFLENTLDAKSSESWNLFTLVMALQRFGKNRGGKPYEGSPTLLLERLAERFIGNTEDFNAQAVGNAFYGLQGIDTATLDPAGLAAFTRVLNVLADKAGMCTEPLSAQAVGNAFYGLQGIDTATLDPAGLAAFTRVLNVLADKAGTCTEPLSAQQVGNAFYGLRGIDTNSLDNKSRVALAKVLEVLARVCQNPRGWITSKELGEASEGLQRINQADLNESGRNAIVEIIVLFSTLCERNADGKQLRDVAKVVGMLQAVDTSLLEESSKEKVAEAMEMLAGTIARLPKPLDSQGISMAFGGLAGIGTGDLPDRGRRALINVVNALSDRARPCLQQLRNDSVGNSLGGLRGIDPSDLESGGHDYGRKVLADAVKVLGDKSEPPTQPLSPRDLSSAMIGLWPSFTHPDTRRAGIATARQCLSGLDRELVLKPNDVRGFASVLRASFCVGSELGPDLQLIWGKIDEFWISQAGIVSADTDADEAMLLAVIETQQAYALYSRSIPIEAEAVFSHHKGQAGRLYQPNETERRIHKMLEAELGIDILGNQIVCGFELDLLFPFDGTTYNIELDGPHHASLTSRLKDEQRDNYLQSLGYHVIRKNVLEPTSLANIVLEIVNEILS